MGVDTLLSIFEPVMYDTFMKKLVHYRERAITLRKKGYTYKEIQIEVPVAKSSLSLWLKDLPLTKTEKAALKDRKDNQISRGRTKVAGILRQRRLNREKLHLEEARQLFNKYQSDPLFFTGIALYWAEGGKRTNQWQFINSDLDMQRVMLLWLLKYPEIKKSEIYFRLYVHKAYISENCEEWWQKQLRVTNNKFLKTVVKPSGLGIKKRPQYKGCLRIEVRNSKSLLNMMRFWQKMLIEQYQKP